jgi:3-dehydroquinate synthase
MDFFRWLESRVQALLGREAEELEQAVVRCVEIKGRIVTRDEREGGRRAMLNFGHTLAHAIEVVTDFRVAHGDAVAAGICLEARLAVRRSEFPEAHARRLESLVRAFGLPTGLPEELSVDEILVATRRDKKARAGRVRYALPRKLGRMPKGEDPTLPIEDADVRDVLGQAARNERE